VDSSADPRLVDRVTGVDLCADPRSRGEPRFMVLTYYQEIDECLTPGDGTRLL